MSTSSTVIDPADGSRNPSSAAISVDLPEPLGESSRTISPGRSAHDSATPSRPFTRRSVTSIRSNARTCRTPRRTGGPSSAAVRPTAARPSSLAWCAAPAARSGR